MTREQFLSGVTFKVVGPTYKGASTFSYSEKENYMLRQTRSSIDDKVILNDYECNITKVSKTGFTGYTFIMKKKVVVKYRFEDLVEFVEEA